MERDVKIKIVGGITYVEGPRGVLKARVTDQNDVGRRIVKEMIEGVSKGFKEKIRLNGVGYRAELKSNLLEISLGFINPIQMKIVKGIEIETRSNGTVLVGRSSKKGQLGEFLGRLEGIRPARKDKYKGKGVVRI